MKMKGEMRIYYDKEGDYLTIFVGEPVPNYGEDIAEGITLFKNQETDEVIGIGIQEFSEKTESLKDIKLKLPFFVSFEEIQKSSI